MMKVLKKEYRGASLQANFNILSSLGEDAFKSEALYKLWPFSQGEVFLNRNIFHPLPKKKSYLKIIFSETTF